MITVYLYYFGMMLCFNLLGVVYTRKSQISLENPWVERSMEGNNKSFRHHQKHWSRSKLATFELCSPWSGPLSPAFFWTRKVFTMVGRSWVALATKALAFFCAHAGEHLTEAILRPQTSWEDIHGEMRQWNPMKVLGGCNPTRWLTLGTQQE